MTMYRNSFFEKLLDGFKTWTKYGLLWLLLTFVLRLAFFFILKSANTVDWSAFLTILSGVYFDVAMVLFVSSILFIPYLIINWLLPKTTKTLTMVFITLYVVIYCCLIGYYVNVSKPLDRVFFIYTSEELYNIVVSSVRFSFWPLVGVLVALAVYWLLLRFWNRKVNIKPWMAGLYLAVTMLFVIIFNYKSLITNDKVYESRHDYCLAVNQMIFTVNDFYEYYTQVDEEDFSLYDEDVLKDAVAYQRRFPNFNYVDIHYPFLRENNDPDVLGGFLNKTSDGKAPDFVFIIVEGLGQRLSSSTPMMSFTPYLDSLKKESLYWPHCLALAERTFGVVPNVFSSAPYGKMGFARVWWPIPDHNSILKDMSKNGYSMSFYFGGNAAFDGQDTYFSTNGVNYMMDPKEADFDDGNKEEMMENHSWGMYDKDLFNAAIRHRDTVARNRPNTDIYITLSTHEPFYFKGQEPYIEKVRKMLSEMESFGPGEKEFVSRNDYMYATYLYTDECIKYIIDYYKSLPEYENTIFVIVGDHRTGCVLVNTTPLLVYNVPLIIYSPLINKPKTFKGVVTHHDIAPTIDAYLHNNYDYKVDSECHWLGTSLDTSAVYHNKQSVAFMLNNRNVVQYLHGDYMIDEGRLFQIDSTLFAYPIENDSIKIQLEEYLRQYKNIDRYVTKNDFLIKKPDNLKELLNYENAEAIDYHIKEKGSQGICESVVYDDCYERVYVDVRFGFKIKNKVNLDNVHIVFKSGDGLPKSMFYKSYKFSEMCVKSGEGDVLSAKTTFFIVNKEIMKYPLKIMIYSTEDLDIECKDMKINVKGLPQSMGSK